MPIYEYVCGDCRALSTIFIRGKCDENQVVTCQRCGSANLTRIMSRFAAFQSEENRLENLADPSRWGGFDESDPKSVANFVKRMGNEMGDEMGREELEQMADEAAREVEGHSPQHDNISGSSSDDIASSPL